MPSMRYAVNIALKKSDWDRLKKLQASGCRIVDVLRAGIAETEKQNKNTKTEG